MDTFDYGALCVLERDAHSLGNTKLTVSDFADLCHKYYNWGWMRGYGGAIACLQDNVLFLTPEHVQKDRMEAEHIFIFDLGSRTIQQAPINLQPTLCSTVFSAILQETGCSTIIHTHSAAARIVCKITDLPFFEISHRHYLKKVPFPCDPNMLSTGDTLAIPIINNQYSEELLVHDIMRFISRNPSSYDAVLVRNHGLIVWGKTWEKAEQLAKSMDALFRVAMKLFDESKPWVINRRCSG